VRKFWGVFLTSWLLLSVLSAVWSLATPISGAPDEPAHFVKAASVARGEFIGTPSEHGHTVSVPKYIAETHAATCFAFKPELPADCANPISFQSAEIVDAETSAGLYNPIYYALVGWPTLFLSDTFALYAMRIVSGIVASSFLAICFAVISTWARREIPILGLAIACTPMVLFLNGVVNPSALETSATLAAFVALLSIILHADESLLRARLVILGISAACAVNVRGLSPLWVAIVLAVPLILLSRVELAKLFRRGPVLWTIGGILAAVGLAVTWTLTTSSLSRGVTVTADPPPYPGVGASAFAGFTAILRETFGYANGLVGQFGWLDTTAPAATLYTWAVLTGALLLTAVVLLRGRALIAFSLLVAALVLAPALVQGLYVTQGGFIWQGRYALPLFVCVVIGAAAFVSPQVSWTSPTLRSRVTGTVLFVSASAQFLTFAVVLQRYAVGTAGSVHAFYLAPQWQPPGGVLIILLVYLVALIVSSVLVQRWLGPLDAHAPVRNRLYSSTAPTRRVTITR